MCIFFVICKTTCLPPTPVGAVLAQPLSENLPLLFRSPTAPIAVEMEFTICVCAVPRALMLRLSQGTSLGVTVKYT